MSTKLNVLLAKTEHLSSSFKESVKGFITMFDRNRDHFKGLKKTYVAKPDQPDFPAERSNKLVATTVKEHLTWLEETNKDYINGMFEVESTNASGKCRAELTVDGEHFGTYSSLELMRLISLLENKEFRTMYETLPVRSDQENWVPTTSEMYKDRDIHEQAMQSGVKKATDRRQYILEDRNVEKAIAAGKQIQYTPQLAVQETSLEQGDWTLQHFSGETSSRERADILRRYTRLLVAAKESLKRANEAEIVSSSLTISKLFGYLHAGKVEKQSSL